MYNGFNTWRTAPIRFRNFLIENVFFQEREQYIKTLTRPHSGNLARFRPILKSNSLKFISKMSIWGGLIVGKRVQSFIIKT